MTRSKHKSIIYFFAILSLSGAHFQQGNSGSVRLGKVSALLADYIIHGTLFHRLCHSGAVMDSPSMLDVTLLEETLSVLL